MNRLLENPIQDNRDTRITIFMTLKMKILNYFIQTCSVTTVHIFIIMSHTDIWHYQD